MVKDVGSLDLKKQLAGGTIISRADILSGYAMLTETIGLTDLEKEYVEFTIDKENYHAQPDGFILSVSGKFRGLGQFMRKTWNDLIPLFPNVSFIKYSEGVGSVYYDLLAIVLLYRSNERTFKNQFGVGNFPNWEIAYLYHQQGATQGANYLRGDPLKWNGQSDETLAMFKAIDRGPYAPA